jgi:tight adherence protein B
MTPVVIAVLVGIAVYMAVIAMMPKRILADTSQYTRTMLQKLAKERPIEEVEDNLSVLRAQSKSTGFLSNLFFTMPGATAAYPKLLRAGMVNSINGFFLSCLTVFFLTLMFTKGMGLVSPLLSAGVAYLFAIWYIRRRINKRNNAFLNFFPDALDIIVRSVRSGYPLNSAVRMVADNAQAPVSTEFKQVADEVAYGSTLIEALQRLSYRIDEPDVRFFVVVLTVQQDVGGNLSEVLNNLANIIRKRKYLRMKIRALASEGRATAWVLGSMPFCEAGLILLVSPGHLDPLFQTSLGHTVLGATLGIVLVGILIVRQMVNIKV